MQQKKKSLTQSVYDNIWASPALFFFVSGSLFLTSKSHERDEIAWFVYLAGWAPPILMGLWCLLARRKPDIPAAPIGLGILVAGGFFHLLLHHDSLPF
jgi:hypothetical protein